MRRLPEAVKRRIVEHLACYNTPNDVADLIEKEFGISLTARHVRTYDPTCFQFAASARYIELHAVVRKRFEQEVAKVPIAHRAFRLRRLNQIHEAAFDRGDLTTAAQALEQAAKEVGNMFVNQRLAALATRR